MDYSASDGRRVPSCHGHPSKALAEVGLEPGATLRAAEAAVLAAPAPAPGAGPAPGSEPGAWPGPGPVRYTAVGGAHVAWVGFGDAGLAGEVLVMNPAMVSIDALADEPRLAAALGRLAATGRVACFDRRGVGLSDPVPGGAPTVDGWALDAAAVAEAAGLARSVVLANADTCLVALALAARRPDLVAGLVLVHPYPRYVRGDGYPYGLDPVAALAVSEDVLTVEAVEDAGRFDHLGHIAPSVARDPAFRAWWDAVGRRAASPGPAGALHRVIFEADIRPLLPAVRAPTLLVHRRACGSYDPGHARYLAAQLADARVVALPGADELWFTGGVADVVAEVERLVRQVTRPTEPGRPSGSG